jgi:hypothetical protein
MRHSASDSLGRQTVNPRKRRALETATRVVKWLWLSLTGGTAVVLAGLLGRIV